MGQNVII